MYPVNNDSLGNGLMQRAAAHRTQFNQDAQENARQHGQLVGFGQLGPLQDPMWEGLFQAMDEQGVRGVKGGDAGGYQGLPESHAGIYQPTFNPQYQQSAHQQMGPATGLNPNMSGPLGGLQGAMAPRKPRGI